MIRALSLSLIFTVAFAQGCSNSTTTMTASGPDMALPHRAADDHVPLWQVSNSPGVGTSIQTAPEVYTVVWPGQAYAPQLDAFVTWLLGSDFWTSTLKEYGVGAGTNQGLITLTTPPPAKMTDDDIDTLVNMLIANGSVTNPSGNTNVMFIVPSATVVDSAVAGTSCSSFSGFHYYTAGSTPIAYSIINQCGAASEGTIFDGLTTVISHELAEAATDTIVGHGYYDQNGQEIADLCQFVQNLTVDAPAVGATPAQRYWVQRMYSFAIAKLQNADPCVPLPYARPFFGITTNPAVLAVHVPASPPKTGYQLETLLEPFAYGTVGPIHWAVESSQFQITPSEGIVMAGDTVRLTIDIPADVAAGQSMPFPVQIDLIAESADGGRNSWPFYIDVYPPS